MRSQALCIFFVFCAAVLLTPSSAPPLGAATPGPASPQAVTDAAAARRIVDQYCVGCHSQDDMVGNLSLEGIELPESGEHAEVWEKVIRMVGGGMMPPAGMPRPNAAEATGLVQFLEARLDRAAAANPNPGRTVLHRMNRNEYRHAIRDLLDLEVEVDALLPPDEHAHGFDNIAEVLSVSPTLMDRYLAAAAKISSAAVGNVEMTPTSETFRVREDLSQHEHIEGLPHGTRGGILIHYNFPVDGEYIIKPRLFKNTEDVVRGMELPHQVEILLDGSRVALVEIGGTEDENLAYEFQQAGAQEIEKRLETRMPIPAGQHAVGVTFIKKSSASTLSLLEPFLRERIDPIAVEGIPEVAAVVIEGPFNVIGPGESASRERIFTCHPAEGGEARACARTILGNLAERAYRRPVSAREIDRLMSVYEGERGRGQNFDSGIEAALTFLLVAPQFLFRFETDPADAPAGAVFRISELELASRLSFFIWSSIPDDELRNLAGDGRLRDPAVLEAQVTRMLADERARALGSNFAGQWLYLRNLAAHIPDKNLFPDFDDNLRRALERETEMLFESIVLEDRSILDLLEADYTFVNERLAKHYEIPGIYGTRFRRIPVREDYRRGLLGHASILTLTSYPNRTSPVTRGAYVLENILGTPPPEPPANVPPLDENPGRAATMRERMEAHRSNPACSGCHKLMDPIGLALENFDAIGRWRTDDGGAPVDPRDTLADGTPVNGPVSLREAILARSDQFARTVTEMLLTYALGRGLEPEDMPVVRSVMRDAAASDYKFSSIVTGIVKSVPFQMKIKGSPGVRNPLVAQDRVEGARPAPSALNE